ncbi:hypothetical protein [Roseovarius sp. MMSF_3281]|uniref:hypothetical protein n=1 Tax=Roseovarius sp. MMSF_3281 TaxID=3046694 RepID=UPI00273DE2C0|nr:hypothetical protein [Roseovarius sp. MMSF_3281]
MPGPYATPNTWFCDGCGKTHPISRDIEGTDGARTWCLASIERGIRQGQNDLPPQADAIRRHMELERTQQ